MTQDDIHYAGRGAYDQIRLPEQRRGTFSITHRDIFPLDPVQLGSLRNRIFSAEQSDRPTTTNFPTVTRWHELREDDVGIWMTDLPVEQEQMKDAVAQLHGRVLVGGLGLGVVAAMLHKAPQVREVIVVEKEWDVIQMVAPALPDDVKIHQGDLYEFLKDEGFLRADGKPMYDSAFFDIWQGDGERIFHKHVIPLRRLAVQAGIADEDVVCWQEDVMRGQIGMGLFSALVMGTLEKTVTECGRASPDDRYAKVYRDFGRCLEDMDIGYDDTPQAKAMVYRFAALYGRPGFMDEEDD